MFIGHYGIGFALKKVEPGLSLGLLIFVVELGLLLSGIALYMSSTVVSSSRKYGLAFMVLILLVFFIGNIFGPPPPDMISAGVVLAAGNIGLVALAFWVDGNSKVKINR